MKRSFGLGRIELVRGNIVDQSVDAIVNAANSTLLGGGGVDGAIHRAAGPGLLEECQNIPVDGEGRRCPTGEVRVTGAGDLQARFVIHGVGPVWSAARNEEVEKLLAAVHEAALLAAAERGCRSIAFPAISTGVYRFPIDAAADIALDTTARFLARPGHGVEVVRFVLFSPRDLTAFDSALDALPD